MNHMRRTYLLLSQFSDLNPQLIDEIFRVCSQASFMKTDWFLTQKGVTAYLTAYWKLYGGRVVGEF